MKDSVRKICNKCGVSKEIGDFYFRKDYLDYRTNCKDCFQQRDDDYYKRKNKRREDLLEVFQLFNQGLKKCVKCLNIKSLDNFNPIYKNSKRLFAECYSCMNINRRERYRKHPEQFLEHNLKWRDKNPESYQLALKRTYENRKKKVSLYGQDRYRQNPELIKHRSKEWARNNSECKRETNRKYQILHKNEIRYKNKEWRKKKLAIDINYRIKDKLRCFLRCALRRYKTNKSYRTIEYFGCNLLVLKSYLESKFLPEMAWSNYGVYRLDKRTWHIDHIVPCAFFDFSDPEQQKKCFHFSNLRPLWADDNIKKSDILSDGTRARFIKKIM